MDPSKEIEFAVIYGNDQVRLMDLIIRKYQDKYPGWIVKLSKKESIDPPDHALYLITFSDVYAVYQFGYMQGSDGPKLVFESLE